jgi:hypothetical protein
MVTVPVYHCCSLNTKFHSTLFCQGPLHMFMKLLGIISVDLQALNQLLISYSAFNNYYVILINWEFNGAVHQLFVDQHRVRLG